MSRYLIQPPALHHDCAEDDFLGAAEESDDGDAPWLPGVEVVVPQTKAVVQIPQSSPDDKLSHLTSG